MLRIHGRWFWLSCLLMAFSPGVRSETPRRDAYGDPLPKGVLFRLGTARLRQQGNVKSLTWMPDGKSLASVGSAGNFRLWRVADGKELHRFPGVEETILSVAVTRDGRWLASGSASSRVRLWEAAVEGLLPGQPSPDNLPQPAARNDR